MTTTQHIVISDLFRENLNEDGVGVQQWIKLCSAFADSMFRDNASKMDFLKACGMDIATGGHQWTYDYIGYYNQNYSD